MSRILGIGELLWDMLPTGPQLGGAPANYSVMASRLGNEVSVLSRIGDDALGKEALAVLKPFPVDCGQLQIDPSQPTGRVTVELNLGQPSYTIHQPVAWDFLEATAGWREAAGEADAVCFGSLAQRSERSRQAIHAIVKRTRKQCQRIFDVNLRAPFYSAQIIRESLPLASVVKMNDVEVPLVQEMLGIPVVGASSAGQLRAGAEGLLEKFPQLTLVAITRGGEGSLLVGHSGWDIHPGIQVAVADTIGAGDAFTAAMTHYLLLGAPLKVLNEAGNRWGSYIASQPGATPSIESETFVRINRDIEG